MHSFQRHVRAQEYGRGETAFLLEHSGQQMFYIYLLVAVINCCSLRLADRVLRFFRQPIEVHSESFALKKG